jgi:hypothetical protein
MGSHPIEIAGLIVHSDSPLFLSVLAVHVAAGLTAVVSGAVAIFAKKRRGAHTRWGTRYYWSLAFLVVAATCLAALRGAQDVHLIVLGAAAFTAAWIGRSARRGRWGNSLCIHIAAMGASYTIMLTAFYVETGDQLPLWKELPHIFYWIIPSAVALPLITYALFRHRLVRSGA